MGTCPPVSEGAENYIAVHEVFRNAVRTESATMLRKGVTFTHLTHENHAIVFVDGDTIYRVCSQLHDTYEEGGSQRGPRTPTPCGGA